MPINFFGDIYNQTTYYICICERTHIHMYQYKHIRTKGNERHTLLVLITMSTLNETGGRHFDAENGPRLTLVENYNANQTANSNRQSLLHMCLYGIWMDTHGKK